ncbi:hypothetical protein [Streptomyces sp. enrichment culture]|uniref:hypothetical protein n=1 Tax=Streptomyces sp. enrichment culture TaxID=1795815 RepID=UPI003F55ABCA
MTRRVGLLANDVTADRPEIKGADAVPWRAPASRDRGFMTRNFRAFSPGDTYKGVLLRTPFEFGGEGIFPTSDIG